MKNSIQKSLLIIFIAALSLSVNAQTNVSGGIYSNTTWTLANSPYIVVDTVVVFPGVTLTIEPGAVVKFDDHMMLEIRQASLIAAGVLADSITFTSNSVSPVAGIWSEIFLNGSTGIFNYCNFKYAYYGINGAGSIKNSYFNNNQYGAIQSGFNHCFIDSCNFRNNTIYALVSGNSNITNCNFLYNNIGIHAYQDSWIKDCVIDSNQLGVMMHNSVIENCIITHGQIGIGDDIDGWFNTYKNCVIDYNSVKGIMLYEDDSLYSCDIQYNGIGIEDQGYGSAYISRNVIDNNSVGIHLSSYETIYCNRICNNSIYNLETEGSGGNYANNYWCTTDSTIISAYIYDGYDNINLGLISFMPIDTIGCYLTGCNLQLSATVTNATCDTCHNGSATAHIANGFAPYTYTWVTSPIQSNQTATGLASGTYTVCVADGHGCTACNSNIFVDSTNCTGFGINVNAVNATCSTCNDGSATVSVSGGTPPYLYTWYTSPMQNTATATGLFQGMYAVCVMDAYGCSTCDSAVLSVGNCSAHFNLYPDTVLHHYYAVNMASGILPLSYSWDWGDGSPFDTIPYPNHTYSSAGYYSICLTITDSAGCTNTFCNSFYLQSIPNPVVFVQVIPQTSTGINEKTEVESTLIFPNPVTDNLTIILSSKNSRSSIKIFNMFGEEELFSIFESQKSNWDISSLAKGIHILQITTGNKTENKKIIKQ
jgi:hypothetical protein